MGKYIMFFKIMRIGKYSRKKIDARKFEVHKFVPFLFDTGTYGSTACGSSALALLTGHNPLLVSRETKFKNHCSDQTIINYLKKYGFHILELTQSNVSNNTSDFLRDQIKPYHVVLLSQLVKKAEATWCVLYNNLLYHNFEIIKINYLEFINRPINTAYLINHYLYTHKHSINKKLIKL